MIRRFTVDTSRGGWWTEGGQRVTSLHCMSEGWKLQPRGTVTVKPVGAHVICKHQLSEQWS